MYGSGGDEERIACFDWNLAQTAEDIPTFKSCAQTLAGYTFGQTINNLGIWLGIKHVPHFSFS
ncbi:hypothetical protein D3C73_1618200 [compost metagenome]